jgi:hypothetical protein
MDYLILGFGNRGALTTLVWPELNVAARNILFGSAGYRDTLCDFISKTVNSVEVNDDETILISFTSGESLRIPLFGSTVPGEKAIFTTPKNELAVWYHDGVPRPDRK